MDRELCVFIRDLLRIIQTEPIWIFMVRGVITGASQLAIDIAEITEKEFIGRDLVKNPLIENAKTKEILEGDDSPYFVTMTTHLTHRDLHYFVEPHVYDDCRLIVPKPLYEDKIRSPETVKVSSPKQPPLEGT